MVFFLTGNCHLNGSDDRVADLTSQRSYFYHTTRHFESFLRLLGRFRQMLNRSRSTPYLGLLSSLSGLACATCRFPIGTVKA
jgi:hypothetical protein